MQLYLNPTRINMEQELVFVLMEDNLNFFEKGRQPTFFGIWKTTLFYLKMEDDLKLFP